MVGGSRVTNKPISEGERFPNTGPVPRKISVEVLSRGSSGSRGPDPPPVLSYWVTGPDSHELPPFSPG